MPAPDGSQTELIIGVDVGGTFTDLVATDGNALHVVKVPSTPEAFERGVIEAVTRAVAHSAPTIPSPNFLAGSLASRIYDASRVRSITHGSTVATNALLQRAGHPIAFITTEGFADMLLIGRQNRPQLYALQVQRPAPITEHCFGVTERIDAAGNIITPLDEQSVQQVISQIAAQNLKHVAVCLLFSFINPSHERRIAHLCQQAGLTVSLSSKLVPEFREYERASTTAINASMRPVVEKYLTALRDGVGQSNLRIMQSSGGTLTPNEAAEQSVRLLLSGPAGGVLGAAYVARASGFDDVIAYDMGGTSTDVATILAGQPQWTTSSTIDGLPIALPMFDIHTVGAGGGSIAYIDDGGALRVGPRSAGAAPGPACYNRGGHEPTVTDANLVLGRILPNQFLGGAMTIRPDLAESAIATLAGKLNKSVIDTALGIVKVAQANMEGAIRAVTSRRGHDPTRFTLVSFGGAGGLHACAIAESLDIPRVLIPPYAGVLSALGMVVAPPVAEASKTVVQLGDQLDDARLAAEYGQISGRTMESIPYDQTATVEAWADVRFQGQSHEMKVRVPRPTREEITTRFHEAYIAVYGQIPEGRQVEIVTLRVRRLGHATSLKLPTLTPAGETNQFTTQANLIAADGAQTAAQPLTRTELLTRGPSTGPLLLIDPEATAYVPPDWQARPHPNGAVVLARASTPTDS